MRGGRILEEQEAVGLADKAQWPLEDALKEQVGVECSRGEIWKPYMVEDRNLITGQNPPLRRSARRTAAENPRVRPLMV
ncbi:hypothetical protein GCM10027162_67970 [Streptomyces incanus]